MRSIMYIQVPQKAGYLLSEKTEIYYLTITHYHGFTSTVSHGKSILHKNTNISGVIKRI
jgi:hypothetical protein